MVCKSLIPALGVQRLYVSLSFKASLVYKVSSRPAREGYTVKPCLKIPANQTDILLTDFSEFRLVVLSYYSTDVV